MATFLEITLYSSLVFCGLVIAAIVFTYLGKFLTDIAYDPDAESH